MFLIIIKVLFWTFIAMILGLGLQYYWYKAKEVKKDIIDN